MIGQKAVNAMWRALNPPKQQQRQFIGANLSRLTAGWVTQPMSLDQQLRTQYSILLARTREQSINNPWVKAYLRLVQDNVVGRGFNFQAKVQGRDGKPDVDANMALEAYWKEASKLGNCEMSERLNRTGLDRHFILRWAVDGEVILMKHFPNKSKNKFRFAVEFIDPRRLDINHNLDLGDGGMIRMGVEVDRFHKPLRYYFLKMRHDGSVTSDGIWDVVPADRIYHKFIQEDVNQTRGVPSLAIALLRLNMLEGYEEAELIAARQAAAKMGWLMPDDTAGGYVGDGEDAAGNIITEVEPGNIEVLPKGFKFEGWDPQHPNTAFGEFVQMQLRAISSGLGVSYNKLANDLQSVTWTSLREGNLSERETWKSLQEWMIACWKTPNYEDSLEIALMEGQVSIDGNVITEDQFDRLKAHEFRGRRWHWVDPLKDAQANVIKINEVLTSRSAIMRENGDDPEEVWDEIAWENDQMVMRNIQPISVAIVAGDEEIDEDEQSDENDENDENGNSTGEDVDFRSVVETYGAGVRAGVFTPQIEDEETLRAQGSLPPLTESVRASWNKDEGTRRPVTLKESPLSAPEPEEISDANEENSEEDR